MRFEKNPLHFVCSDTRAVVEKNKVSLESHLQFLVKNPKESQI